MNISALDFCTSSAENECNETKAQIQKDAIEGQMTAVCVPFAVCVHMQNYYNLTPPPRSSGDEDPIP